jgi:hypothetical protein
MLVPRRGFAVAALDGFIFAGKFAVDHCFKFGGFLTYFTVLYENAAGGFDGKMDLSSVERYDPVSNEWKSVANMTTARSGFGLVVLNGRLHAVGGYDGRNYLSSAEIYDHRTNSWSTFVEAALPIRMAHFASALV